MQAKETTIPEAQVSRGEAYFKEALLIPNEGAEKSPIQLMIQGRDTNKKGRLLLRDSLQH